MYGNLQKHPDYGRYSELAGWLFVRKLGDLFGTIDVVNSDSLEHLKSCRRVSILVTLTQFKRVVNMETTLQKRKPMEFEYSTF